MGITKLDSFFSDGAVSKPFHSLSYIKLSELYLHM